MRIPLAPAGLREMVILTLVFGGVAGLGYAALWAGHGWGLGLGVFFTHLWFGGLAFFRDPERTPPAEADTLVSPADGKVTESSRLDYHEDVHGPAMRIGIFLSIFDVHVNRSPCSGVVRSITYQRGKFLDARDRRSGAENESNTIVIEPEDPSAGPIVVRQVAGKIARRIVCSLRVGDRVERGQRIGLIKFGSRTELIVPVSCRYVPAVRIGDHARGATTILARRGAGADGPPVDAGATGRSGHAQACVGS